MSRKYVRNPSRRKAGLRKPGFPPPLYARVATPGMGGGVTVFILPLTSYGCRIAPPAGTPLDQLALLYGFVGGVWSSPLCTSITNAGDDGEGTLLRLEFNAELDAGQAWELNLNTTVPWVESPQGARLAGLVDTLASPPPSLWSEATNLSDAPPVPPTNPTLIWVTSVTQTTADTIRFATNGASVPAALTPSLVQTEGIGAISYATIGASEFELTWDPGIITGASVFETTTAWLPSMECPDGSWLAPFAGIGV